jgi:hypothetical protein
VVGPAPELPRPTPTAPAAARPLHSHPDRTARPDPTPPDRNRGVWSGTEGQTDALATRVRADRTRRGGHRQEGKHRDRAPPADEEPGEQPSPPSRQHGPPPIPHRSCRCSKICTRDDRIRARGDRIEGPAVPSRPGSDRHR